MLRTRDHLTREQYMQEHDLVVDVVVRALRDADAHPEVAPSVLLTILVELTDTLGTDYHRREVARALVTAARKMDPTPDAH